jgi:hypothetical protein
MSGDDGGVGDEVAGEVGYLNNRDSLEAERSADYLSRRESLSLGIYQCLKGTVLEISRYWRLKWLVAREARIQRYKSKAS